jgi:actin-related protein
MNPMEDGYIDDFDLFELVLGDLYQSLKFSADAQGVVIAEPHFNPPRCRHKTLEIFFEHLKVPELTLQPSGVLALIGTGRVTGLILDSGHAQTTTVPIFESFVVSHAINRVKLGGSHVETALAKILSRQNICKIAKTAEKLKLAEFKHSHIYACSSLDRGLEDRDASFRLPDGSTVNLRDELWEASEVLFNPEMLFLEMKGIPAVLFESVKTSPMDLTKPLLNNIVLAGGNTKIGNFDKRLAQDLKNLVPSTVSREVRLSTLPDSEAAAWTGGKVFASLRDGFNDQFMSRAEYYEFGPDYLRQKAASSSTR